MLPTYFDIHSHLNFKDFDADRSEVISRMKENEIWTITVGVDETSSVSAIKLAEEKEGMFATVGVHPTHTETMSKDKIIELAQSSSKVVALGECGLDYYRIDGGDESEKKRQHDVFANHIEAAIELNLPLMIHGRAAYADIYDILSSYYREHGTKLKANMHFFAGSIDDAKKFLSLGFTLSFDGPITFADSYDEVIRFAPLEAVMAETDAPFASPAQYRGRRNEPSYVIEIVKRIAEIKGENLEKVKKALVQNAFKVFNLERIVASL